MISESGKLMMPPYMIVYWNEMNIYSSKDSVDSRLYMTESEALGRFAKLQCECMEELTIAEVDYIESLFE